MAYIDSSKSYQMYLREIESRMEDEKFITKTKKPDEYFLKDENTKAVIVDLISRAQRGYKKYNTTLGENNHQNMLQHAYEEALDLAQYLKKEITTLNTIQDMVKQYPNDADLGEQIRLIYGKN